MNVSRLIHERVKSVFSKKRNIGHKKKAWDPKPFNNFPKYVMFIIYQQS